MNFDYLDDLNRIIELAIKYGNNEIYIEILLDAMDDYLNILGADGEYIVDDDGKHIPQFCKIKY